MQHQQIEFRKRREALFNQMQPNSAALIFAAKEQVRSGTQHYPYRQNSNFYYLTGIREPEMLAVLLKNRASNEFILFNRSFGGPEARWRDEPIGQERACGEFGANRSFAIAEIDKVMPELLRGLAHIYFNLGRDSENDRKVHSWVGTSSDACGSDTKNEDRFMDIDQLIHNMRLKKSPFELENIRKAIAIAIQGHTRAMHKCKPGMYEYELRAELLYEFMRLGADGEAFETIVASGSNACVLHYSKCEKKMPDGELVLIDAGVECNGYASDVSRTFPVNGRFSQEQRAIYEVVLKAQEEVIRLVRPGIRWDELQLVADRAIASGLIDLGLLKGKVDDVIRNRELEPFCIHKIGHWMGLDVHDVGGYRHDDDWHVLEAGMVFTVEPGIYLDPSFVAVDNKWANIGVRIEDNVLVTDTGCEVLSGNLPKGTNVIESLFGK